MKTKIAGMRKLVKAYRSGNISKEEITEIERVNGMGIEELMTKMEAALNMVSHKLGLMTITELKRWKKGEASISEQEKEAYASANHCTYEQFVEAANNWLDQHEARRTQTWVRQMLKETEEESVRLHKLVEEGKATTEDGKTFVIPLENMIS